MPTVGRVGAVATVATLAFCVWLLGGWGSPPARIAIEDLGFVVLALFVTGCCAHAAWRFHGRQRTIWVCVTIGMAGYAVGSAVSGRLADVHGHPSAFAVTVTAGVTAAVLAAAAQRLLRRIGGPDPRPAAEPGAAHP